MPLYLLLLYLKQADRYCVQSIIAKPMAAVADVLKYCFLFATLVCVVGVDGGKSRDKFLLSLLNSFSRACMMIASFSFNVSSSW